MSENKITKRGIAETIKAVEVINYIQKHGFPGNKFTEGIELKFIAKRIEDQIKKKSPDVNFAATYITKLKKVGYADGKKINAEELHAMETAFEVNHEYITGNSDQMFLTQSKGEDKCKPICDMIRDIKGLPDPLKFEHQVHKDSNSRVKSITILFSND